MTRRLYFLLVVALACGLFAAGCGGDDNKNKSSGSDGSSQKSGDTSAGSGVKDNPQVKQAVENCKRTFEQTAQLSQKAKNKAKEVCDKAGSGDVKDAQKAAQEVCAIVIEDTVPSGPAREQALTACKQAAQ